MIVAWLLKNWRLIAYAAAAAAALWMLALVGHWRKDSTERLPAAEAALEAERLCGEGSDCAGRQAALEAAQAETTAKVVATYETELAAIRSRPARVVRLCPDTGHLPDAGNAPGPGGTAPAVVPGQTGRDIGPELYDLAREADEVAARLRALQEWNRALAAD